MHARPLRPVRSTEAEATNTRVCVYTSHLDHPVVVISRLAAELMLAPAIGVL